MRWLALLLALRLYGDIHLLGELLYWKPAGPGVSTIRVNEPQRGEYFMAQPGYVWGGRLFADLPLGCLPMRARLAGLFAQGTDRQGLRFGPLQTGQDVNDLIGFLFAVPDQEGRFRYRSTHTYWSGDLRIRHCSGLMVGARYLDVEQEILGTDRVAALTQFPKIRFAFQGGGGYVGLGANYCWQMLTLTGEFAFVGLYGHVKTEGRGFFPFVGLPVTLVSVPIPRHYVPGFDMRIALSTQAWGVVEIAVGYELNYLWGCFVFPDTAIPISSRVVSRVFGFGGPFLRLGVVY